MWRHRIIINILQTWKFCCFSSLLFWQLLRREPRSFFPYFPHIPYFPYFPYLLILLLLHRELRSFLLYNLLWSCLSIPMSHWQCVELVFQSYKTSCMFVCDWCFHFWFWYIFICRWNTWVGSPFYWGTGELFLRNIKSSKLQGVFSHWPSP